MLGPPGSGKGTQSKMLAIKLNLKHISTGDIFRTEISNSTELGKKVEYYLANGLLVPDELTNAVVVKEITDGFVIDGYPRNISQAEFLNKYLSKSGLKLNHVVFLDVPYPEIVRRLTNRRICPRCGRIFNLVFNKPEKDELCDSCGIKLKIRDDDTLETVKKRISVYEVQTAPLLEFYKDILKIIQASGDADGILKRILSALND